jgi:hypothetical protein
MQIPMRKQYETARGARFVTWVTSLLACAIVIAGVPVARAATPMYEEAPISYSKTAPQDAIAKLTGSLARGEAKLESVPKRGYLDAVLRELKISPASQVVVFTKTSFQRDIISPSNPRAIYFNDDTYVGYVPGGDVIEIASVDPKLGTIFYTVDQKAADEPENKPGARFVRELDNCLQCHGDSMTRGVPGLLVRSVFSDSAGLPILQAGTFLTTHESPIKERWGGWYTTGATPGQPHMGNTFWKEQDGGQSAQPVAPPKAAMKDLTGEFDTSAYLTPHSDVVALMVLEHQAEAHNRMTRASHGTLRALRDEKVMADALGETLKPGEHSESTLGRISHSCEPLVEYLLFVGEAPLTGPIEGSSAFAAGFAARGLRDGQNRSLRDLDLKTRLFRYPCSYLIYSRGIDELPDAAKTYVYRRLGEVLGNRDTSRPAAPSTWATATRRSTSPASAWSTGRPGRCSTPPTPATPPACKARATSPLDLILMLNLEPLLVPASCTLPTRRSSFPSPTPARYISSTRNH